MTKRSAGILLYRGSGPELRLLLVHPGGPFWAKKDLGEKSGSFSASVPSHGVVMVRIEP